VSSSGDKPENGESASRERRVWTLAVRLFENDRFGEFAPHRRSVRATAKSGRWNNAAIHAALASGRFVLCGWRLHCKGKML